MIFVLPVTMRAILNAASLASVPEVAKKNLFKPRGRTSINSFASSARTSVAYPGPTNASFSACSLIESMTARFLWPSVTHMSCAEKSRYFTPFASTKWQPSASTTCSGDQPFWRRHVPYVYRAVKSFTSADDNFSVEAMRGGSFFRSRDGNCAPIMAKIASKAKAEGRRAGSGESEPERAALGDLPAMGENPPLRSGRAHASQHQTK